MQQLNAHANESYVMFEGAFCHQSYSVLMQTDMRGLKGAQEWSYSSKYLFD